MKTPTWATVVAILMIIFGGCSVINDIQAISMPSIIEKQKELISKEIEEDEQWEEEEISTDTTAINDADSLSEDRYQLEDDSTQLARKKEAMEVLNIPEFTKTWIVRFGYIGIVSSLLYILGGVFLLVRKSFSIKLAYTALIVSILCSGAGAAVLTSGSSSGLIALTTGLTQLFGVLIDIVLLAVIFASDKEAYKLGNTGS